MQAISAKKEELRTNARGFAQSAVYGLTKLLYLEALLVVIRESFCVADPKGDQQ